MPATQIHCPSCKEPLRVPTPLPAGRLVKCPHCTKAFPVHLPVVPLPAAQAKPSSPPSAPASPTRALAPAVHKITCPKCRTTLRTPGPLPAGRLSKCPRCATVFRAPGALRTPVAAPVTPVANAPGSPAKPSAATYTWVKCPKCRTVLRLPGTVPAGKSVKCGQCTTVFLVPAKQTKPEAPKVTTLAKPQAPSKGAPPRPVMYLDCPGCKTALKLTGKLPVDQSLKCPKCARPLRLLPKKPAAKTKLVAAAARKTKLAAGPAKKTKVAAGPAKKTKLAAGPAKKTVLAPTAPARQPVASPAPAKPQAAPGPRPVWIKVVKSGLYVALAGVLAALGVVGAGFFGYGPLAPKGDIPASAWQEFAPPGGRCRVLMPGEPKQLKASKNSVGGANAHNFVVLREHEDAAFRLTFWDRPSADRVKVPLVDVCQAVEQQLREDVKGIVVQRSDISLNGHTGKEWVIEPAEGGTLIARLYQVKGQSDDRFFVLLAGGARLKPGIGSAPKFFDSFRVE